MTEIKTLVASIFPTPVVQFNYDPGLSAIEIDYIKNLNFIPNTNNFISKNKFVLDAPDLSKLKIFVQSCLNYYLINILEPADNFSLELTQSWVNVTKKEEYHPRHIHPNSFVSGVFYIQADREKDSIDFYRSLPETITYTRKNYNVWNSQLWTLPVETNNLILFPSYFAHGVSIIEKDRTRISLSFNSYMTGELGRREDANYLSVKLNHRSNIEVNS
jgi:uncharacterized protein (TIGR02466 family)